MKVLHMAWGRRCDERPGMKRKGGSITKKSILFFFVIMVLFAPHAHSEIYYNFTDANPWLDVNQGGPNYCWAASAADMLAWSGWGVSSNPLVVYNDITSHWPDNPGSSATAISWYLNGGYSIPGGNYYPIVDAWNVMQVGYSMNAIVSGITAKDAVDILIMPTGASVGHYLTVWGYQTDATGNVDGLYITDSESQAAILQEISVWQTNGQWDTSYGNDYIYGVTALEQNSAPMPGAILLFGPCFMGLVAIRRRFKK